MSKGTKCGCNKQPCDGECRKLHLNRARKPVPTKGYPGGKIPRCPAAYEDSVSKKKKER